MTNGPPNPGIFNNHLSTVTTVWLHLAALGWAESKKICFKPYRWLGWAFPARWLTLALYMFILWLRLKSQQLLRGNTCSPDGGGGSETDKASIFEDAASSRATEIHWPRQALWLMPKARESTIPPTTVTWSRLSQGCRGRGSSLEH